MQIFVDLSGDRMSAGGDFGVLAFGGLFECGQRFLPELAKLLACLFADLRAVVAELFDESWDLVVGANER
jgi:hypothetical protein